MQMLDDCVVSMVVGSEVMRSVHMGANPMNGVYWLCEGRVLELTSAIGHRHPGYTQMGIDFVTPDLADMHVGRCATISHILPENCLPPQISVSSPLGGAG
ncbi:hypothetical protein ACTXT7_003238 [Hymenolepis weldensis]